jgi:hypothetical protein
MIDIDTVRKIALSLPEAEDRSTQSGLQFHVRGKQFAWTYLERVEENRPRRPRLDVLAVRCAAEEKEDLLASAPDKFFTSDHYRGFPAILVRLEAVGEDELRSLLTAAWRCQAPRALAKRLQ